jgi:GntR family transcriptional regulator/MocR family aminotransferase
VGALQGLAPDLVAYTGSVSKSLAPGLRLGWLVPPAAMFDDLVEAKRVADLGNAAPDQAALADFIRTGRYDRHLRLCQRTYRDRRDALRAALAAELPDVRTTGIAAGLHLIAEFPSGYGSAVSIVERAAGVGVRLYPAEDYAIGTKETVTFRRAEERLTQFVLGYSNLTPRRIVAGVRALAQALR